MDNNFKFWSEFIELYRYHTCLWDSKSNEYLNKHKRNASYSILLEKLKEIKADASLELLKKKIINNMRTAFRRELKKVQESKRTGTGGDTYEPTLWYYDLLLFTAQSETGRKGQSTDEWEGDIRDIAVDTIEETEFEDVPPTPFSPDSEEEIRIISENDEPPTPQTNRSSTQSTFRSQKRTKSGTKVVHKKCVEQKREELLNLAHNALKNDDGDEYCFTGRRLGYQLKGLQDQQRFIAEKLISYVMFHARMGKLKEDAMVLCRGINSSSSLEVPVAYSIPQSTNHASTTIAI